jgi:solute carrier family 25 phosphate transporter 3
VQTNPTKYRSIGTGFSTIVREQGLPGLFRGWLPTLLGYSAQGAFKFGLYEYFKKCVQRLLQKRARPHAAAFSGRKAPKAPHQKKKKKKNSPPFLPQKPNPSQPPNRTYADAAGAETAAKFQTPLFLAASASAEFFADAALAPFEAVKVAVQTRPGFAKGLFDGMPKLVQAEGVGT